MDNYLEKIKRKNIHIVGAFGAEGSAILGFLTAQGVKNITAHDFSGDKEELWQNFSKTHLWIRKKSERLAEFENLLKLPAVLNFKNKYLEGIADADLIFVPSSWYLYKPNFPALQTAKDKGIEFSSLTKLYFQLAEGKIISVTGTKGKGTTSRLIYEILLKTGKNRNVYLAGNDRRSGQELDKVSKMAKDDILVLETSNRQLMIDLGRSPDIGVITNISPDHIDEHGSYEKYIEVKKSLFKDSGKNSIAVLNFDNGITRKFGEDLIGRGIDVCFFSRKEAVKKGILLEKDKIYANIKGKEYICDISDIKLIGGHNLENVLAAALSAYLVGANPEKIREAIVNFKGLRQRIEFIGEYGDVRFYDDTASTNPDSTIAAIKAIASGKLKVESGKLLLIAGGDDKGMDYAGLAKEIIEKVDALILLPGSGSEKLKLQITNIKQIDSFVIECNDFLEAMEVIKAQTKTGDTVLISPACAHFQARYIDVMKKPLRNLIFCHFEPISRQGEIV